MIARVIICNLIGNNYNIVPFNIQLISAVFHHILLSNIKVVIKQAQKDFREMLQILLYPRFILFYYANKEEREQLSLKCASKAAAVSTVEGQTKTRNYHLTHNNLPTPFQFSSPQQPRFYITNNQQQLLMLLLAFRACNQHNFHEQNELQIFTQHHHRVEN